MLDALGVIGVLCVEFFLTRDGRLLINELAPRPHNSGHFTFDACVDQPVRAAAARRVRPAARLDRQLRLPPWPTCSATSGQTGAGLGGGLRALPDVKLHLYGKPSARPGRKMGHLTALGETPAAAARLVLDARAALTPARGRAASPRRP